MRPLAILMLSALALLPVACERAAPARDQATPAAASASAMEFRGERPCADCDGIEACRFELLKASKGRAGGNFIEGMACVGGCIGGAGCLTHGEKSRDEVYAYGKEAYEKTIADAIAQCGL